jgi:hypothetical protein
MIGKLFLIAISISAYLAFQRSWFYLVSLPIALFFGYEQYVRSKMLEYRARTIPGKLKTKLTFLPYSEEEFNNDFRSILPSTKARIEVFPQRNNLRSRLISFNDGLRKTSFRPLDSANKIYLFGGSTMLCEKVPDDYTIASQLQKIVNSRSTPPGKRYDVINFGVRSASLKATYELFKQIDILKGDVCLFYFGVGERHPSISDFKFRSPLHKVLIIKQSENLLKKIQLQSLIRHFNKLKVFSINTLNVDKIVKDDENLLNLINMRCQSNDVKFLAILQPVFFTRSPSSKFDKVHTWHQSNEANAATRYLFDELANTYKKFKFFHDGRGIFNDIDVDVYVDWCQLNYLGNKTVANYLDTILEQQLL